MGKSCLTSHAINASSCPGAHSVGEGGSQWIHSYLNQGENWRLVCEMKVGAGDVPVFLRNRVSPQLGRAREAWTEDELLLVSLCTLLRTGEKLTILHPHLSQTSELVFFSLLPFPATALECPISSCLNLNLSKISSSVIFSRECSPSPQLKFPFPFIKPHWHLFTSLWWCWSLFSF